MTDARDVGQELPGTIVETVLKSQEAVINALKSWADAIVAITPPIPVSPAIADKLPKPEELVATAYDLAEQVLATQRKFAEEVLKATAPVLGNK